MAVRKKTTTSKKRKSTKKAPVAKVHRKVAKKSAKSGVKRATAKKVTKHADGKKATGPISVGRKPFTKSQFVTEIAERTGVARKEATAMLECVGEIIAAHLHKQGPEIFSWPGMFKIQVVKKPATKSRTGTNPFTGESMVFKAKPASRRVKVRPLKQLKAMAG